MLHQVRRLQGSTGRVAAATVVVLAGICSPGRADAQATALPDGHDAQPERPTFATHAHTVAPGWIELEAGFSRQKTGALSDRLAVPLVVKIGLAARLQLNIAPGWQREADDSRIQSGITDLLVGLKWRVVDDAPLLGAFAVQTSVSVPTGSEESGLGTGSAGLNLLAISSHQLGPVALDANVAYTRLGGDNTIAPRESTLWAVAAGIPVAARLGWCVEVFGFPGTSGPAGARPQVGFLTGPTVAVRRSLVLDAGAIFDIDGFGGTSVYAGVTWNLGRLWRSSEPPRLHRWPQQRLSQRRIARGSREGLTAS